MNMVLRLLRRPEHSRRAPRNDEFMDARFRGHDNGRRGNDDKEKGVRPNQRTIDVLGQTPFSK